MHCGAKPAATSRRCIRTFRCCVRSSTVRSIINCCTPCTDSAIASRSRPMRRLGLRTRVAALCAMLGLIVSACLSAVAVPFSDSYVHRLIDEMLRVEGDYLRERYAADGVVPHPRTKHYYAFVGGAGAGEPAPPDFIPLGPGLHEVEDARGERHVAVYDVNGARLYVVLDIGLESV